MYWMASDRRFKRELVTVSEKETVRVPVSPLIGASCVNCKLPISSNQFYQCVIADWDFRLHTNCNQLPPQIQHPRHPEHPLILHRPTQFKSFEKFKCSFCEDKVLSEYMDIYSCKTCRLEVEVLCAFPPGFRIDHGSHPQHPLLPVIEEVLFLCHACGTRHHGRPLICNLCGFWIDRGCAQQLPPSLAIPKYHPHHSVKLGYSLPADHHGQRCQICEQPINPKFWVYYCTKDDECRFFAHVRCATSKTEPFMSILNPARNRWVDEYMDDLYKKTLRLPVETPAINLVPYFKGHQRWELGLQASDFIFHETMPAKLSSLCNGCIQPISAPFYSFFHNLLKSSGFLVHKDCAEVVYVYMGGKKDRVTADKIYSGFFGMFECEACQRPCNGYLFRKLIGSYTLDLKCALAPEFIVHESHPKHRLILDKRRYGACPCCLLAGDGHGEEIYRCETCSFNLHPKCALYPSTVRHRYDKHPLRLTYKLVGDRVSHDEEIFCEICELDLNTRGWFYHCTACDRYFHVTCIPELDKWSNIKFGGTIKLDCHEHRLTFERFVLGRACQCCGKTIDPVEQGMAFRCKVCAKYQICFACAESKSKAQGQNTEKTFIQSWDTSHYSPSCNEVKSSELARKGDAENL